MPAPEAILAITSGFINSVNNGSMLPYMATSLHATGGSQSSAASWIYSNEARGPGLPQRLESERWHVPRTRAPWKSGRSCSAQWLTVDVTIEICRANKVNFRLRTQPIGLDCQ